MPSARVAVVHDAGRLDSAPGAFLEAPVKVVCGTGLSGLPGGGQARPFAALSANAARPAARCVRRTAGTDVP
ncbi:hypothetical protein CVT30_31465 [Streptomyces sp. AMCC400023]|nr:hypothetical protein CVT30_31465 [Streptomyces sp. AMCC400023]